LEKHKKTPNLPKEKDINEHQTVKFNIHPNPLWFTGVWFGQRGLLLLTLFLSASELLGLGCP
jgi:hypothetical protein